LIEKNDSPNSGTEDDVFGAIITLAQREPYAIAEQAEEWQHTLFGHFDVMRVGVTEELSQFKESENTLDTLRNIEDRMYYRPETHKVFLYAKKGENNEDYNFVKEKFKNKNSTTFFALVAVKTRSQLFNHRGCTAIECIGRYMEDFKQDLILKAKKTDPDFDDKDLEFKYYIMNSLSIDDVYILINTDNPDKVLHCIERLQFRECSYEHRDNVEQVKKHAVTKMKNQLSELCKRTPVFNNESEKDKEIITKFEKLVIDLNDGVRELRYDRIKNETKDIQDFLNRYFHDYLGDGAKYEEMRWLMDCVNAIRICDDVPIILHTHTVIGFQQPENAESISNTDLINIDIKVQSCPGMNLHNALKELLNYSSPVPDDEKEKEFSVILGRFDFVYNGTFTLQNIVKFYAKLLEEKGTKPDAGIRYSSGNIIFNKNCNKSMSTYKNIVEYMTKILNEENRLSNLWAREQYKFAVPLFNNVREKAKGYPFLIPLIDAIDRLHIQGCSKFFYALRVHEFEDAAKFFVAFYRQLERAFDILDTMNTKYRAYYAQLLALDLQQAMNAFSGLFNDRIILDMSMYENTRPSLYATGAYERVLKRYNEWIKNVRAVVMCIEDGKWEDDRLLNFLVVPEQHNETLSLVLFRLTECEQNLSIYFMSFDEMLEIDNTLSILVHEIGHYIGIIGRKSRVKTYFSMVAYFYARRISRDLCSLTSMPSNIIDKNIARLADELQIYFKERLLSLEGSSDKFEQLGDKYMDHAEILCRGWLRDLNDVLLLEKPNNMNTKKVGVALLDLYRATGVSKYIKINGQFNGLSETKFVTSECKRMIREAYSDYIMIHVLDLDVENYFEVLVTAFVNRNKSAQSANTNMKLREDSSFIVIDAIRAISALLPLYFTGKVHDLLLDDNKNNGDNSKKESIQDFFDMLYNEIYKVIEEITKRFEKNDKLVENKIFLKTWNELSKAMINVVEDVEDKNDSEYHIDDWMGTWRLMLPYLYRCTFKISTRLQEYEKDYEKNLRWEKIKKLYKDIYKEKNSMKKLDLFLTETEDSL
jgi:hypothetical protein